MDYDYNYFLDPYFSNQSQKSVGSSNKHNIDKTGIFYHVTTSSRLKERIYFPDVAKYRRSLLFKLCKDRNVKIMFSVTMPNHTHEVFMAKDWESIAQIIKTLNMNVSKFIRSNYKDFVPEGKSVFSKDIAYTPIRSIQQLFYVGKYIQSNADYLLKDNKTVPDSCFWMFEKDYYPEPFDSKLYTSLFDMKGSELLNLYSSMTRQEAIEYSRTHFTNWTQKMQKAMFYKH